MKTVVGVFMAGIVYCTSVAGAEAPGLPKPVHIQVQVQFVAVTKADADALLRAEPGGIPGKDKIVDLVKQGKAKVLCAPSVTTLSGLEAIVKAVDECIYPTSLDVEPSQVPQTNTAAVGASRLIVASPSNFEMREVGVILQCVPEVREAGNINVKLMSQLVATPIWKTYKTKCVVADGREKDIDFEQPFFSVQSLNTSLVIKDGETIVAGGGMPDRNGEANTFLLVTARLLDASGHP
ncbi:MAG: hypothetical protein PHR35_15425 [Kiritimatiellae bacterium]|nr:hypothetical protein [Kiritimatiellia bacterium]